MTPNQEQPADEWVMVPRALLGDARWRIANLVGPAGATGHDREVLDRIDETLATSPEPTPSDQGEREAFDDAFFKAKSGGGLKDFCWRIWQTRARHAPPPAAAPVELSDDDIDDLWAASSDPHSDTMSVHTFARAVIAQPVEQWQAALRALQAIRSHWREFGPEHGFDECLEMNARLLDATPAQAKQTAEPDASTT